MPPSLVSSSILMPGPLSPGAVLRGIVPSRTPAPSFEAGAAVMLRF
jgi:hypothetical protein